MTQPLETCGPKEAFQCPKCGKRYGDALYHGPWPHTPTNICLDCWAAEWARIQAVMQTEGDWSELDEALFLVSQGVTQSAAAAVIGRCRKTLYNWIRKLRRYPHLVPDWLTQKRGPHV